MASSIGNLFRLTTFGESHGPAMGGVLDGCPSGLKINFDDVQDFLNKRRPGFEEIYSQRKEADQVEFLSGIYEGVTLGTPIAFLIRNSNQKSKDYEHLKDIYRPSHADFTYYKKYGLRDYRGGGRASARDTVSWVVAGAIASQILELKNIQIFSFVSSVGHVSIQEDFCDLDLSLIFNNNVRCPSKSIAKSMEKVIQECKLSGDTVGGQIFTIIKGVPAGLGEPVFDKIQAGLSKVIMSINACKGVSFGSGFDSSQKKGSNENDVFVIESGSISTKSNNSGGVQGGITNGQDICFSSYFKPPSSIRQEQKTVNNKLEDVIINVSGRHDPCIVPRAVPIVASLTAMTILDYYLLNKTTKLSTL